MAMERILDDDSKEFGAGVAARAPQGWRDRLRCHRGNEVSILEPAADKVAAQPTRTLALRIHAMLRSSFALRTCLC
jgi:hypothetical protein